jgi:hypothetical protein
MAVATHNVASRYLVVDLGDWRTVVCPLADAAAFPIEVVEFEHDGIGLTAVATRVVPQEVEDVALGAFASSTKRRRGLSQVQVASLTEVRLEALPAPPLVTVLVAVERGQRQRPLAPLASPL